MPLKRTNPLGGNVVKTDQFASELPPGGNHGQVLRKRSAHDYDIEWEQERIGDIAGLAGVIDQINQAIADGLATKVDANAPISASPDNERLVGYDTKGLVTGSGGRGVIANAGISASANNRRLVSYDTKGLVTGTGGEGVIANSAITASATIYRIVRYDTKGLVTAGITPAISNVTGLQAALDARQIIKDAYSQWFNHLTRSIRGGTSDTLSDANIETTKVFYVSLESIVGDTHTLLLPDMGSSGIFGARRTILFHIIIVKNSHADNTFSIEMEAGSTATWINGNNALFPGGTIYGGDNVYLFYTGDTDKYGLISAYSLDTIDDSGWRWS